jgi:hypothetical protein
MTVQLNSKVHRLELLSLYVLLGNTDGSALLNKANWHLEIEQKVIGLVLSQLQLFLYPCTQNHFEAVSLEILYFR